MNSGSRIFIAGTQTLAGKTLTVFLKQKGFFKIQSDADVQGGLQNADGLLGLFKSFQPEHVFFTGASSLGIGANQKFPAGLLKENVTAALNVFESARQCPPRKILYLASSCIYPISTPQPMKPEFLGTGPLEPTSRAYAQAKIFGMELAVSYARQYGLKTITAIPADPFGPEDSFHPEHSHVVSALIRKIHAAKISVAPEVTLWGTGEPVRDFLYSEDLAAACVFLMENFEGARAINISSGNFMSITQLAKRIAQVVEFTGKFNYDISKPDGALEKTLDASEIKNLGWRPGVSFEEGLRRTYQSFCSQEKSYSHA